MKRLYISLIIGIFCFYSSIVFASSDDWERSLKDMERNMKMQANQARELERQQELPQNDGLIPAVSNTPAVQPVGGFSQDPFPKTISTDRAMVRNQERLKEMIDAQSGKALQSDGGYFGIPKAYKGIVDLTAIILFMLLAGFIFYRKKIKKKEIEEAKGEDEEEKKKKEMRKYYKYYKSYHKEGE